MLLKKKRCLSILLTTEKFDDANEKNSDEENSNEESLNEEN